MSPPATESLARGRYRLSERLASGGMGAVWRGEDIELGRPVAVKLLHEGLLDDPSSRERFRREARAAAALAHPNIAAVYDFGEDGARPFLVMELVEGETLAARLAREGPLDPAEVTRIGAAVAEALAAAHEAGVVHRDVKPGNVMLATSGQVKVLDFGIAATPDATTLTASGSVLGTAPYLAPERVRGDRATPASDLYALGVMLYEMLAGEAPFARETPAATALAHLHDEPPPLRARRPDTPPALAALVAALLEKDPAARPASGAVVAASLGAAPPTRPIAVPEPATAPIPLGPGRAPSGRRSRLPLVALALLLALVAGVIAFQGTGDRLEPVPPASPRPTTTAPALVRVPDLRGPADEDRVRSVLAAAGLDFGGIRVVDEGPAGIVGSEPSAGTLVPKGTDVVVLVNLPGRDGGKGKDKGGDQGRGNEEGQD